VGEAAKSEKGRALSCCKRKANTCKQRQRHQRVFREMPHTESKIASIGWCDSLWLGLASLVERGVRGPWGGTYSQGGKWEEGKRGKWSPRASSFAFRRSPLGEHQVIKGGPARPSFLLQGDKRPRGVNGTRRRDLSCVGHKTHKEPI